jgi:hypothetical protein
MEEMRKARTFLVIKKNTQEKRPLGRHRDKLDGNHKMNCQEIWCEVVDWVYMA